MAKIELELDESLSQFVKGLRGTSDGQRDRKLNTIVSDYVDQEELKEELREIHEQLGKILTCRARGRRLAVRCFGRVTPALSRND